MRHQLRLAALSIAAAFAAQSQTVDTAVLGTVADPAGGAIPNARVTVSQAATGFSRSEAVSSTGTFEFRYLIPGNYTVEVQATGFRSEIRSNVDIQIGQQAKLEFSLQVGSLQQAINVEALTPLLQTENATLAGVVGQERIENLPLNGRKFDDLAILTPGVSVYNPDLHSSSTDGSEISGNGSRPIWGQVNVDGITMVNNRHNYVNLYPSLDAVQEFKVQTGDYSAEYGGNAGTNVNIQLKSGSNQFHGDLFEFFRNNALDARNYFTPPPIPVNILKQNQFGATLGGAVIKDKLFFFASYEGLRSISESPSTAEVLTPAQRMGDFSASSTPIIDPRSGSPFPNNMIQANRLDPVSLNIINTYMPLPNTPGVVNYSGSSLGNLTTNQELFRVDYYASSKDQLFAHYIYAKRDFPNRDLNPSFSFTGNYPISNFDTQYIHTFAPNLLNELRVGFDLENVSQLSTRTNTDFTIESLGIEGMKVGGPNGRPLTKSEEGFPLLNISGYIGIGDDLAASNLDNSRTYQFVDNLTWVKGRHTLKFGTDVRKLLDDATTNNWPFGIMNFTGDISGDPAADYMLGFPRTVLTPEGVPITKARQWRSAFYGQDDWKVSSKLTVNLGLRYDLFKVPQDVNNVTRILIFPPGGVPQFYPAGGQHLSNLWKADHLDFSPRVGFAYNLFKDTVVRGGYGIFYFGGQFDNINILQLNPPAAGSLTIINPASNPVATIENPIPASLYPTTPIYNAVTIPADRRHPDTYVQNWNLQVSKQIGSNVFEISYVGSKGTHVDSSFKNFNQPAPGPGDIQSRRPYPEFARIRMQDFGANTSYNSLQIHFERRLSKGLSMTVAYTYSHLIDDAGQTTNDGGCLCQTPTNGPSERASSLFDERHNLVVGYVWEVPLAKNSKGLLHTVAAGWNLEGIVTIASGNPFDVLESFDSQNNDGLWERPLLVSGQKLTVSNPGPALWFNKNAFAPSTYVYGNSPRDPLVGPGTSNANLSLIKKFRMFYNESHVLQFRAEAFNALNKPQFGNPDSYLGDGAFGQVTNTKLPNRELQFALKYMF